MSGVEVAGLVLGCLPLLIQGIESYNEGLDPVKSFVRWERELPQLIRKLRNQHVHYAQTMRILLEPITTEFELAEMLSEPGTKLWKDDFMAHKLKDKLQDSYHAYESTIEDIERITKKIASKLDLDRAAEVKASDLEALLVANPKKSNDKFEIRKRIRFGMSKKSIKALLEELNEANKELERFTDKSEKIENMRKSVKPSFANRLQRIQNYATSLHEALSVCWQCSCKSQHKTNLELDQRGSLYVSGMKKGSSSMKTSFKVSFSSSPETAGQLWRWQAAEIFIDDEEDVRLAMPSSSKPKPTKTVSFGDNKPPPPYSITDPAVATQKPSLEEVKDLCASIQRLYKSSPCIGFSFDSKRLRGAYPVESVAQKQPGSSEYVTLEELLNRPPVVNGRPAKLSKKERYSLALTLASSTLQLNATPWFQDQWAAKDIMFHQTTNSPRLVDIDHPYVAPKLAELANSVNGHKPRGFQNKNTILLALAVSLLELYFGISAEKHQELEHASAEGAFNPWQLCAMTYKWADEEQENLSAAFSGAVNHCLRCFGDPGASLQDPDFLQAAVESIVLPLQNELYQFLGKSGP